MNRRFTRFNGTDFYGITEFERFQGLESQVCHDIEAGRPYSFLVYRTETGRGKWKIVPVFHDNGGIRNLVLYHQTRKTRWHEQSRKPGNPKGLLGLFATIFNHEKWEREADGSTS